MKMRILSLLLALALCVGLSVPALADNVESVWNDDFSVLFTVTVNFHQDWGLYDDQYAIQTITGYRGSDSNITIPSVDRDGEPIQAINDYAFENNTSLTSVTIPSSITSIGMRAFSGCSNLTSVTIPDSVVRMGSSVFTNCSSLKNVTLPSNLAAIDQGTFFFCESLTSMTIPSGVSSIGNSAFWGCSSLTSVTIPASVTSIAYGAFMDCGKLTDIYYEGTAAQWAAISINNDQNYNDQLLKAKIHYGAGAPTQPTAPVETVGGFNDVLATAYYADPVKWAVENSITTGTSATAFSPDATCTRGQIITFLWRAAGAPEPKGDAAVSDVTSSDYYDKAVRWAAESGMFSGETFAPNDPCTRAMAVEFMWKQAGEPTEHEPTAFTDVPDQYADAVAWAVAESVTTGTSAAAFSPDATCTRGQIVTFLYRAFAE